MKTATRTSPTPLTCTNQAFLTNPAAVAGPTAENPTGRPNTAPVPTGLTEADRGTHVVALQDADGLQAASFGPVSVTVF